MATMYVHINLYCMSWVVLPVYYWLLLSCAIHFIFNLENANQIYHRYFLSYFNSHGGGFCCLCSSLLILMTFLTVTSFFRLGL